MIVREVPLSQGKIALVDEADYGRVMEFKWCAFQGKTTWYAHHQLYLPGGKRRKLALHRFIIDAPNGFDVDHINGNGLDCRRENIRIATEQQNNWNSGPHRRNSTGFKGVTYHTGHKKFRVRIQIGGREIHLGEFSDPVFGAMVYDAAARHFHGEFARLNVAESNDEATSVFESLIWKFSR